MTLTYVPFSKIVRILYILLFLTYVYIFLRKDELVHEEHADGPQNVDGYVSEYDSDDDAQEACTDHTDINMFQEIDDSYYKPKFLEKKRLCYFPKVCARCVKPFLAGKVDSNSMACSVTKKFLVRACPMALKTTCKCRYALCHVCFKEKEKELDSTEESSSSKRSPSNLTTARRGKRARKEPTILMPGEKLVGDSVVAAV